VKKESLHPLGLILAALCMVTVASSSGELLILGIMALLCLLSYLIPARIAIPRRIMLIISLLLIIPFAALILIHENQRIIMIAYRLFRSAGAYFSMLTVILAFRKRDRDDPLTLLMYSMIILICGGFIAPPSYQYLLIPITLFLVLYCLQIDSFSKGPDRKRNLSYWFNLAFITAALFLSCLGLYKFFMWSETEVSNLMSFLSPPLSFSNAFADRANLEAMDKLKGSTRVVLRVKAKRSPTYLMGKVFTRYVNRNTQSSWETTRKFVLLSSLAEEFAAPVRSHFPGDLGSVFHVGAARKEPAGTGEDRALPQDYMSVFITSTNTDAIFVPRDTLFVMIRGDNIRLDTEGVPSSNLGNIRSGEYHLAVSREPVITALQDSSPYLEVPDIFSPDVARLNERIIEGCESDLKKAEKIQGFFHGSFTYGVGPRSPKSKDIIEDFLLRSRQGHCEFFASAMALLLRMNNIPSRYVNGFLVQEYNTVGGYYVVRERDAHAWVEAYFPDRGWVTFDPTPPQSVAAPKPGLVPPFFRDFYDFIMLKIHSFKSRIAIGDILGALLYVVMQIKSLVIWLFSSWARALVFMLALFVIFALITRKKQLITLLRLRSSKKKDGPELAPDKKKLIEILMEFEKIMVSRKLRRPPTLTPLEFLSSREIAAITPEKRACIEDFYRSYCILRYSRPCVTDEEVEKLRERVLKAKKIMGRK
jgi:protein-glutamine gamma-glutamyltransferase